MAVLTQLREWMGGGQVDDAGEAREAVPGTPEADAALDRRRRDAATPRTLIEEAVALKILHGWLQNRDQTMVPLSINLGRLSPEARDAVVTFAAVAAHAGASDGAAAKLDAWLVSAGADEAATERFQAAQSEPPALHVALREMERLDLAVIAFVAALVAARDGDAGRSAFADYVAARLSLPSTAVRSAERRYRV